MKFFYSSICRIYYAVGEIYDGKRREKQFQLCPNQAFSLQELNEKA